MSDPIKAKSKSVSLSPILWGKIDAVVATKFSNNRSEYFRTLVEDNLDGVSGDTNLLDSDILVILTRRLIGERSANELSSLIKDKGDQSIELEAILKEYLARMKRLNSIRS